MIHLLRSSPLFYRKICYLPLGSRSFSSLKPSFEDLQNQIKESTNIEVLFRLVGKTQNLAHHALALKQIGTFLSNGDMIRDWFREEEYNGMIDSVKKNLEDLGPDEICDLSYFLRITNSYEIGERLEQKLFERVGFFADDRAFNIDSLAALFYDWSILKYTSNIFDKAVLNEISAAGNKMNFSQISKFLFGLQNIKHYHSNEIADTLIQIVLNKSVDDYSLENIPELMCRLYEVSKVYPEGGMWTAIKNFENYLMNSEMKGEEIIKTLEFYSLTKNHNAPLVQKCISDLSSLLSNNPALLEEKFEFLIKGLQLFCSRTGVKMPQELVNTIINYKMKKIQDENINAVSEFCHALGYIANEIPADLLEFFREAIKKADPVQYFQLATGLSKLDPEFNFENYENNMFHLKKRMVESSFLSKFAMVDLIDKIKHPSGNQILSEFINEINEDIIAQIRGDKLCLAFMRNLRDAKLDESSKKKLQPSIKHIMEFFDDNWDEKHPWHPLSLLVQLAKGNEDVFKKIISMRGGVAKGAVEVALERSRESDISIKAFLSMFNCKGCPYAASQVYSMKYVNMDTNSSDLEKLITRINPRDVTRAINLEKFNLVYYRFFEAVYKKGLLFNMRDYLYNFNEFMDNDFLTENKGLYIGGMMARAKVLEDSVGLKLLNLHKNSQDLASLLRIISSLPGIPEEIENIILDKIFTIDNHHSFKYFSDNLTEYLYSSLNGGEKEKRFIREIKDYIGNLNEYEYDSLQDAFNAFGLNYNGPHPELAEAFTNACLNKLLSIAKSSEKEKKVKILTSVIEQNCNADIFNIVIENFEDITNYKDLKRLVKVLNQRGINNEGILEAFSKEMMKNVKEHLEDGPMIVRTLADLGLHTTPWASALVSALTQEYNNLSDGFESKDAYVQWIWGLLHFDVPQEFIINSIEKYNSLDGKPGFNLFLLNLAHFFAETPFPIKIKQNNPLKELNSFVDAEADFGIKTNTFRILDNILQTKLQLLAYKKHSVGSIWTPYYLPSLQTSIWPITREIKLFNNKDFRGTFLWHKKLLEKNCNILTVDQDFLINSEENDVEDWFISNGIK